MALIEQWQKMEGEKMKLNAKMTGFAQAMYAVGKEPWPEDQKQKIIVDNDAAFAAL